MGNNSSQFQESFFQILNEEPINTLLSEEIYKLTYEQFLESLKELNILSKKCFDLEGNQLIFVVKEDTDSTIFWKATVQVACVKLKSDTQTVETYKLLSLSEFLKVFRTFKCQLSAVVDCERNEAHDTCPICRDKLNSTDDTWVLSEVPKAEEVSKEIHNNLMELTHDRSSCSPS
ncbi:hypothetical protein NQ317_015450 [Molorchus minor]|uniref:Uncharacterized protein n=1 Tax=Molorchus minor TaxID=1323400 RepID=A0ABQ9JUB9_9CUCU|nr:hypothetical protein NQ317_015450 [Molorchus minor]